VTQIGNSRDRAIIVLMLHTGLRARELCTLTRAQVEFGKRSGTISVLGKRNKQREIPLNATARAALLAYDLLLCKPSGDTTPLFLSKQKHTRLTERGLGYLVKKYAERAHIRDVSPHDLRHRFFGIEGDTPFLVMDYAPMEHYANGIPKGLHIPFPRS
jgi:integrase/recombinase XerD